MADVKAPALEIVDRLLRLTLNEHLSGSLPEVELQQLQAKAQDCLQVLALDGHAAPTLCALASDCVCMVEKGELDTGLARLVSAGCELLAAVLAQPAEGQFWVEQALEDVSDQFDFLALEVYCGLGRLDGAVLESDALPVVLDPLMDDFGSYWGSIEHRQALQELSAWLLCVVFRALGSAVCARSLMDFANRDVLCLCSLMRGLFSLRPEDPGLPEDTAEVQRLALHALCGLAAPELAFAEHSEGQSIEQQTQILHSYHELLCSAIVETALLEPALQALRRQGSDLSLRFFGLLAVCAGADVAGLAAQLSLRADRMGSLLETLLAQDVERELLVSCAKLTAVLARSGDAEDGFTLACRALLAQSLPRAAGGVMIAALAALAHNVGDLAMSLPQLTESAARLPAEDRQRAADWLGRAENRLLCCEPVLALFSTQPAAPAAASQSTGIRDLLKHAPPQFRCALDGRLLCDPVVTPQGSLFERSTLLKHLKQHGTCPVHGVALRIEECHRSADVRKAVTEWVRAQSKRKRAA